MTREEAIKIVCNIYQTDAEKEALGTLIPELAESDDERIRMKIIENVRLSGGYTDEEIDEMISWLEKRKERKPAEWNEDSVEFEEGFKAGRESGLRDGQKYVLNNLDSYGLCKPAEWNTNDKAFIKDCARILDENGYTASAERLLSMFPIKPAEWSEEDENARQNLIAHFEGKVLRLSDEAKKEAVDWLKSLRPPFKDREMSKVGYPTSLDEIDQWLFDSFGILPGCCSSMESVKHTTARMVAEALWPKKEDKK